MPDVIFLSYRLPVVGLRGAYAGQNDSCSRQFEQLRRRRIWFILFLVYKRAGPNSDMVKSKLWDRVGVYLVLSGEMLLIILPKNFQFHHR